MGGLHHLGGGEPDLLQRLGREHQPDTFGQLIHLLLNLLIQWSGYAHSGRMTTTAGPAPAPAPGGPGPAPRPGGGRAGGSVLWTRPFVLLAAGQALSRLGDGLFATALVWTALRGHGPAGVAVVTAADAAPLLAGSVIGASYADRHDRRRLMITADLIRLALLLVLAAALARGGVPLLALAGFAL